jgi:type VI secretion system ImpM family protein
MIWSLLRKRETQPLSAALLGKLPCQADFVREGFRGAASDALDAFLVQATPSLHHGVGVPKLPRVLLFQCLPKQAQGLIGVCAPSTDAAGRDFPVVIAHAFDRALWRTRLGEIFWSFGAFLDDAGDLVTRLPDLTLSDVRGELGALSDERAEPGSGSPPPAAAFDRTFAGDSAVQSYALYAFASAFAAGQPGLTLDCPASDASLVRLWLELATRLSDATGTTICATYAPSVQRLLISINGWTPSLLRALADPSFVGDQVWPLTTELPEARDNARIALQEAAPALARLRGLSLSDLCQQLTLVTKSMRG